jgi:hypothetical protein
VTYVRRRKAALKRPPLTDARASEIVSFARGAAFVAGLPEGTVIEFRAVEPPMRGRPGGEYATFPVRRTTATGRAPSKPAFPPPLPRKDPVK